MSRILVVEDDAALARGLVDNLAFDGHEVQHAPSAEDALVRLERSAPDLLLLDLMLPRKSGFDVLRELAGFEPRPRAIVVSARDADADIVRALDLGAHDYVRKPFALTELLARVRVQLREATSAAGGAGGASAAGDHAFADVRVSFRRFRLWKGRTEHLLSHLEVKLLALFIAHPDQPLTRAEILDRAWGKGAYPSEHTVDNFVLKLRRKIEDDPALPRFLVTVHGHGYRFAPVAPEARPR